MIKLVNRFNFNQLGIWHIVALSFIAIVIIVGQVMIQVFLENQRSDSRVVNLAGRQRMLSQRISLYSLKLHTSTNESARSAYLKTLEKSINAWKLAQEGLIYGNDSLKLPGTNSKTITALFEQNKVHYNAIVNSSSTIVALLKNNISTPKEAFENDLQVILENEPYFLESMDAIVFQYDHEAWLRVKNLSTVGYIVLSIVLVIILLVIVFIFIPTANHVKRTINKLVDSEKQAIKMAKEINTLYLSLEKSYKDLTDINISVETPKLIAKADNGGNITEIYERYTEITGYKRDVPYSTIASLFHSENYGGDFMDHIIDEVSEGKCVVQEVGFKGKNGDEVWLQLHVVPVQNMSQAIEELVVLAADLTEKKYAETVLRRKDLEWIEKKIKDQKFRSVLVLEGQEEERKRIAMDIHDGIGQLLTSLKFQIESINLNNYHDATDKLYKIKELTKGIIKEARRVTFDLKPSVLSDYGIHAGLSTYIKEVDKLTDININFQNSSGFRKRFSKNVENNIYRIVQEAVNNAIKYSGSEEINVILDQDEEFLYLRVTDKGKGFNRTILNTHQMLESTGNGIFNMQERADYINADFEIDSTPGNGTSVKLKVPLQEKEVIA